MRNCRPSLRDGIGNRRGVFTRTIERRLTETLYNCLSEQGEKLRPRPGVLFERAEQAGSLHERILFLHATHHHAKMLGLDDNRDAYGPQRFHQRISDLNSQVLLDLETAREHIDDPSNFGETNDFAIGNVSDVRPAHERQQMMLAHRVKFDVFDEDDLARIGIEDRVVNQNIETLAVAISEEVEGARGAVRSPK